MPDLTPKLGLKKPLGNEFVSRAAYCENLDILDANTSKAEDLIVAMDGIADLAGEGRTTETVKRNADALAAHLTDNVSHVPYVIAAGAANTYTVILAPVPETYTEGMALAVKINVQNTGASTINVNGLGAKTIKKANGNDVSAGNLKVDNIYTLRYNGVNFILQGEGGGEYGTAGAAQVLTGYTVGTETGLVDGTMPNIGEVNITPRSVNQAIPAGYHNGEGIVAGDNDLIAANIKAGVNIFGVNGTLTPFAYNKGVDNINLVQGYTSSGGTFTKAADKLILHTVIASTCYSFGVSNSLINFTPFKYLVTELEWTTEVDSQGDNNNYWFQIGLGTNKTNYLVDVLKVEPFWLKRYTTAHKKTEILLLDVSAVSTSYYLKINTGCGNGGTANDYYVHNIFLI